MDTLNTISRYTNEQAIQDGFKKAVAHPRRFGFMRPVTITSALFEVLNAFPEGVEPDYELRELTLLTRVGDLVRGAIKVNPDEYLFTMKHLIGGVEHDIWCVLDGDGYTVMLPSDY